MRPYTAPTEDLPQITAPQIEFGFPSERDPMMEDKHRRQKHLTDGTPREVARVIDAGRRRVKGKYGLRYLVEWVDQGKSTWKTPNYVPQNLIEELYIRHPEKDRAHRRLRDQNGSNN